MTYTEMIEYVRLQISEEVEAFYDDEDIERYLKNAINRFCNKTHCIKSKQIITYVNGTGSYALNFKPLKERAIVPVPTGSTYDVENALIPISYEDYRKFSDDMLYNANACYIDNQNNTIYLSTKYSSGNLYCEFYVKSTDATAEANVLLIPEEYHEAICDYAIYLCYMKDREVGLSNIYYNKYVSIEVEAVNEIAERDVDPISNDFRTEINNPHREYTNLQDIRTI